MAHQVTLEEAATHLPELVREARGGQEVVFTEGRQPVARLIPVDDDVIDYGLPGAAEMAQLAMSGGAFDWLEDEPDLYSDAPATTVQALLKLWQQEGGLPARPEGAGHFPVQELFARWDREDQQMTPEEAEAEQSLWTDHQGERPQVSI